MNTNIPCPTCLQSYRSQRRFSQQYRQKINYWGINPQIYTAKAIAPDQIIFYGKKPFGIDKVLVSINLMVSTLQGLGLQCQNFNAFPDSKQTQNKCMQLNNSPIVSLKTLLKYSSYNFNTYITNYQFLWSAILTFLRKLGHYAMILEFSVCKLCKMS